MRFRLRRYYLYYLARVAAFKFNILPIGMGLAMAEVLGSIAYLVLPKYRKIAVANLTSVFADEKTEREIEDIARRVFINLCKNAVELVSFKKFNKDNINKSVHVKNGDIIDRSLGKSRGVIVITAHFGNWELLAATLRLKGYAGCVIGKRIYFDKYNTYLTKLRGYHGVETVYRDESPKKILKVLRNNGIVGILADQDVDSVDGVFVDFFGRKAYTPKGPVLLAMASGADMVPAFVIRENGRHTLVIEKPIELANTGDKENDVLVNTQRWSAVVESYIRRYPEQWVWMHRRWKTKEA